MKSFLTTSILWMILKLKMKGTDMIFLDSLVLTFVTGLLQTPFVNNFSDLGETVFKSQGCHGPLGLFVQQGGSKRFSGCPRVTQVNEETKILKAQRSIPPHTCCSDELPTSGQAGRLTRYAPGIGQLSKEAVFLPGKIPRQSVSDEAVGTREGGTGRTEGLAYRQASFRLAARRKIYGEAGQQIPTSGRKYRTEDDGPWSASTQLELDLLTPYQ
ncbi:unnamed protein product [Calypogeia fissa]